MTNSNLHSASGTAREARSWIESSTLPEDQKKDLLTFVGNFPSLTFTRDDTVALDRYATTDDVELPTWLREARSVLACVDPPVCIRVDDFQWYNSPNSDEVGDIWYEIRFGYAGKEQRQLLFNEAGIYPIGAWSGSDESYLGVDLQNPTDTRIFEFSYENLLDNKLGGRPVRGSLYPVFASYTQLLAHVVAIKLPNGAEIKAKK